MVSFIIIIVIIIIILFYFLVSLSLSLPSLPPSLSPSLSPSLPLSLTADSVMVTHVDSPTDFYIQYVKDIPALVELNASIKKYPLNNVKEVEPSE